ncbi:MAG TPA: hypothetical protein VK424_07405 [Thermoplasmata archaeon]|nr:hypothetical protein [Thermoplasmata archaeon]
MSGPPRRDGALPRPPEEDPTDEEYVRAYATGYEEGVRSALREVLGHAARGHTTQELRMLAESRLARLSEEVDLKRRSLLAPPRRPAWGALLRPPTSARAWLSPVGPTPPPAAIRVGPGRSVLVREERPARALEILRANVADFPRVAVVSLHPPSVPGLAAENLVEISPTGGGDALGAALPTPGEISGRLRAPTELAGGALVYVDALEFLATEHTLEMTLRFVNWLVTQVHDTGSALVVSFDPRSLDLKDASRLERAFQSVL